MVHRWVSGAKYRHDTAKDLDILVIKVRYQDEKRVKLLFKWISQITGEVMIFPGNIDGKDNITIKSDQFKYWRRL